jgi:flavorubredoxin
MAGGLKDFFDRILGDARGKVNEKPYIAFSSAGMGGKEAIESIDRICAAFKMKRIAEGVVATGKPTPQVLAGCQELGKKLAMAKAL